MSYFNTNQDFNLTNAEYGYYLDVTAKNDINLTDYKIDVEIEDLFAGHDINLNSPYHHVSNIAIWFSDHEIHVNGVINIDKALFISADHIDFENCQINCPNIYAYKGTEIHYGDNANIGSEIQFIGMYDFDRLTDYYVS